MLSLVGEDGTVSSTILDSQLSLLSIHGSPIIPEGHVIHTDGRIVHPLEGHMIPHLIPRPIPDPRIMPPNENEMLPLPDSAIVSPSNGHATGDVFLRQEAGPETNQSVAVMIEPNTLNLLGPIGVQVAKVRISVFNILIIVLNLLLINLQLFSDWYSCAIFRHGC